MHCALLFQSYLRLSHFGLKYLNARDSVLLYDCTGMEMQTGVFINYLVCAKTPNKNLRVGRYQVALNPLLRDVKFLAGVTGEHEFHNKIATPPGLDTLDLCVTRQCVYRMS